MTCRHCATSCGARRRSRRASPKRSPAERVCSWVTAYGTSELPVIACNELEGARLDTVGRPVPGVRAADRVAGDRRAAVGRGEVGEIQVRSDSVMAGYLPDEATAEAFSRRLVPHRRRRLPRRRRLAADHRPRQGNDQGARLPGRARRDRGRAARASRPSRTARCSACPTRPTARPSSPRSRRAGAVEADELIALVADRLASYKRPSRVVFVPEIPRLPSGKVLRRVLKERLWTSV